MTLRLLAAALLLPALAACDLVDSESGEFEASVSGDVSATLAGPAISDVQPEGAQVVLIAEGEDAGSNIRVLIDSGQLAVGTLPLGEGAATLRYNLNAEGVQIPFDATAGTLVLDRVEDVIEGSFTAEAATPAGAEVSLRGTFRAPNAITP